MGSGRNKMRWGTRQRERTRTRHGDKDRINKGDWDRVTEVRGTGMDGLIIRDMERGNEGKGSRGTWTE